MVCCLPSLPYPEENCRTISFTTWLSFLQLLPGLPRPTAGMKLEEDTTGHQRMDRYKKMGSVGPCSNCKVWAQPLPASLAELLHSHRSEWSPGYTRPSRQSAGRAHTERAFNEPLVCWLRYAFRERAGTLKTSRSVVAVG